MADAAQGARVDVVTLGECLYALVAGEPGPLAEARTFHAHVAGAEANVAVGVSRLGRRAAYIGRTGADGPGTAVIRRLRGEGVDISALTVDPEAPTGVLVRERRSLGAAEVVYLRSGSAGSRLTPRDVRAAARLFSGARWVHVTGVTAAISVSAREAVEAAVDCARENGATVSLDLNIRRKLWSADEARRVLRTLVGRCDVVLGGLDEAELVGGDAPDPESAAANLVALGATTAVVKLGMGGALELRCDADPIRAPAVPVAVVVDAVGAGDAFAAGYIVATLEGLEPRDVLAVANACGAAAISVEGDLAGLPTRAEVERLIAAAGEDAIR